MTGGPNTLRLFASCPLLPGPLRPSSHAVDRPSHLPQLGTVWPSSRHCSTPSRDGCCVGGRVASTHSNIAGIRCNDDCKIWRRCGRLSGRSETGNRIVRNIWPQFTSSRLLCLIGHLPRSSRSEIRRTPSFPLSSLLSAAVIPVLTFRVAIACSAIRRVPTVYLPSWPAAVAAGNGAVVFGCTGIARILCNLLAVTSCGTAPLCPRRLLPIRSSSES